MAATISLPFPTSAFSSSPQSSKAIHMHGRRAFSISVSFVNAIPVTSYRSKQGRRYNCLSTVVSSPNNEGKPDKNGEPFVLTTPLYYVNAPPHMGSAYTTIAADALARFQRLQGKKVVFITGTDEHGEKIAIAASANHQKPKDHCDHIASDYQALWKDLDISYDKFIRTTNSYHEEIVKEFYLRVFEKGDIYCADYEGLYCVDCEEYKDENMLLEGKCCPIHRKPCEKRKEDNYFFSLSKYQRPLEELLTANPLFVRPANRLHEVQNWVKSGLRDFSISRASVDWGIPVPNDSKQTIYVWFDALLGYISALLKDGNEPTLDNAVAAGWPASVHLIGKDILRFHAVYWPAMLMSAGLNLPATVFGHGFLTKDGLKMGKSMGNVLEPRDLVERFGSDAVRYFFLREVEFGSDGDYSEERFISIVNAHLANTIGNLLNRTLGLLKKNCQSTLAFDATSAIEDLDNTFIELVTKLLSASLRTETLELAGSGWKPFAVEKARNHYMDLSFSSACAAIIDIGNAGNIYMDERAPWSLFKQGSSNAEVAGKNLIVILETVRIIAVALSPVTPLLCRKIYLQLGYSEDAYDAVSWEDTTWGGLKMGQIVAEPQPIFRRIEDQEGETPENIKAKKKKGVSNKKKPEKKEALANT